jgi:hypothetical protein
LTLRISVKIVVRRRGGGGECIGRGNESTRGCGGDRSIGVPSLDSCIVNRWDMRRRGSGLCLYYPR